MAGAVSPSPSSVMLGYAIDAVRAGIARLELERASECYSVSEAVYVLCGRKESGLTVWRIPDADAETDGLHAHWFLRGPFGELIDMTAGQFEELPDYRLAKRAAFYPQVSNLAKELMRT